MIYNYLTSFNPWQTTSTAFKNYTCWICLNDANKTESKQDWLNHNCGCNLQLHKFCFVKLLYNTLENEPINQLMKRFYESVQSEKNYNLIKNITESRLIIILFNNGNNFWFVLSNGTKFILKIISLFHLPILIKLTIWPFLDTINTITSLVTDFFYMDGNDSFFFFNDSLSMCSTFEINCPQCNKNFIDKKNLNIVPLPILLKLYNNWDNLVRLLVPIALSLFTLLNPFKILFKIGLWQLRCLFPENQLKLILNIQNTKSLDVYIQNPLNLKNINWLNLLIVSGFPLCLIDVIRPINTDFPYFKLIWKLALSSRIRSWTTKMKQNDLDFGFFKNEFTNQINLLQNCNKFFTMGTLIYYYALKPIIDKICDNPKDNDFVDSKINVFARSLIWPWVGAQMGKILWKGFIKMKELFNLTNSDIFRGNLQFSTYQYIMIFNLLGFTMIGISSSIITRIIKRQRNERMEKIIKLVRKTLDDL